MKPTRRPLPLTNSFLDYSSLKTRIAMLQTKPTHRRALLGYALALPLALGLLFCTQQTREETTKPRPDAARQSAPAEAAKPAEPVVNGEVLTLVEEVPEFKGGTKAMYKYLGENIKYPEAAERANVGGTVFVSFVVTTKGEIADVNMLKGIGFGCDEEAMRVVRQMPRWTPAQHQGRVVNVKYNLPIRFSVE
jgi:TonB family protein